MVGESVAFDVSSRMAPALTLLATIAVLGVQLATLLAGLTKRRILGIELIREESEGAIRTTMFQVSAVHVLPWLLGTIGLCILLYGGFDRSGVMLAAVIVIGVASLYAPIPLLLTTIALVVGVIVFREDFFVFAQPSNNGS